MIKKSLLILCAFFAGLLANKIITLSTHPAESPAQCDSLTSAKNDLIAISQNEYQDYLQIKDQKQKYEKADELLGKVMLLFLADIGFKTTKMSVSETEVKNLEPVAQATPTTEAASVTESEPTSASKTTITPDGYGIKDKSALIRNLKTQAQIIDALDKAVMDNPKLASAGGTPVEQAQMKIIEGNFSGEIKFFDKSREAKNVTWELIPNYREKPILVEFHMRVFGGGKGENNSTGRGELRHVSLLAEDQYAYMVEFGDNYIQMYYNAVNDQFFGNYYETKDGTKKYNRVGLVNLRR